MPRPSLRRTVSSPIVRARALSNPYQIPFTASSQSSMSYPIFTSAARTSSGALTSSSARRVMSMSSDIELGEYSHPVSSSSSSSSDEPESPSSNGQTRTQSRRVLADITWWFDGQMEEMGSAGLEQVDGGLDSAALIFESGNESMENAVSNEGLGAPESFSMDYYPPSPTSSTTSSSRLSMVFEEANIPWSLPSGPSALNKNRRDASFSSISSSDFEDIVPSAPFV